MRYRTLVFDFDGTIADSLTEAWRIYNQLAPHYALRTVAYEELHELRHLSLKELLKHLNIPKRRVPSLIARGTGLMRGNIDRLEPISGMAEALKELSRHVEFLGILTSNSTANVELFLERHALRELFEFVSSTARLTGKAKHLRAICKTFSLAPTEVLYVGDELRDVKAAQKARIPQAAVTWGFNSRESLAALAPTYLVDSPEDFLRFVA